MLRPDGPTGPLVLEGIGRDLYTDPTGQPAIVDAVRLVIAMDYLGGKRITSVVATPPRPDLELLRGCVALSGFRRLIRERLPDVSNCGDLVANLLNDVPGSTLISNAALRRADLDLGVSLQTSTTGVCAGWVAGGAMDLATQSGRPPVGEGPPAPPLDGDDPLAWHELPHLPPGSMRRLRRLDLVPLDIEGNEAEIDAMFRDVYVEEEGGQIILHEYSLFALLDVGSDVVKQVTAVPRVLPAFECPRAAESASHLVGAALNQVHQQIGETFVGLQTCTHLNAMLVGLGDVPALLGATRAAGHHVLSQDGHRTTDGTRT